jgi:hexosaminidase
LYGFELKITKGNAYTENAIILNFERLNNSIPGACEMTVDKDKIYIGGNDEQGVFYGIQTLLQLLPVEKSQSLAIQQCSIVDSPRFAYRGLHLDVGRHLFPASSEKRLVLLLVAPYLCLNFQT